MQRGTQCSRRAPTQTIHPTPSTDPKKAASRSPVVKLKNESRRIFGQNRNSLSKYRNAVNPIGLCGKNALATASSERKVSSYLMLDVHPLENFADLFLRHRRVHLPQCLKQLIKCDVPAIVLTSSMSTAPPTAAAATGLVSLHHL